MKRLFFTLVLAIVGLFGFAQTIGDAFYIYRNDGDFNAFFRSEVDSIVYSNYDNDGIWHDDIVSQVVYAQDSIYTIPLTTIDSVSFIQPEIILQSNVVRMPQEGLMDYLLSVDGMSLLFDKSMPQEMQPKAGDVLLCTDFSNPILDDGFVGKVLQLNKENDAIRVYCDSIYDIFDIFEQLIAIEKVTDEKNTSRRRVEGEWTSSRNSLDFNLGFSRDLPGEDNKVSLSGSVNGTYIAKIIYNITRKGQQISLWIDHDWQYGAHLNFTHEGGRNLAPIIGPVTTLPAIRFPAIAPIFMFQISGAPFAKIDGKVDFGLSLNSPVHSYVARCVYNNGAFSGWNHAKSVQEGGNPIIEAELSLNGSVQAGYMVDFWLGLDIGIKGFSNSAVKLGSALDLFLGPKINGNIDLKLSSESPNNIYSIFKDNKLELALLDVEYEISGQVALGGYKQTKHVFCNGTIETPLRHEWFLLPEFSDLSIFKNETELSATISCEPTRDILFPLSVGISLYDKNGILTNFAYQTPNYKHENEGFLINQTFKSLSPNKEYDAKPIIKFLGMDVPASPSETFTLNREMSPAKITNFEVNSASFVRDGFEYKGKTYYYNYAATTTVELESAEGVEDWGYVYKDLDGDTVHISVKDLGTKADSRYHYYRAIPKSTATLYGYARYGKDNYVYDEPKEYPLEYIFHPKAYVGEVIADSITTTTTLFEYGFDDVPRTGKCFVAYQSVKEEEPIIREVSYTEKDTIKVNNLHPETTYDYWAYVEYAGKTYMDLNGKKSFTTLTPNAYVEKADEEKITTTSAQVIYGFKDVPENAKCYIHISSNMKSDYGDGEIVKQISQAFEVSDTIRGTYEFTGLYPGTTYTYSAYIDFENDTWFSNIESFRTKTPPPPVASTGDCSNVTTNSATVSCTYENVPEGATYGVEYTWNEGSQKQPTNSANGTQTILLNGLKPGTTYTYRAYIADDGQTYYGEDKTFTTKYEIPDISGTWNCIEYQNGSLSGGGTFHLETNGTVTRSNLNGSGSELSSSQTGRWSINADGQVYIYFEYVTRSGASEKSYSGTINSFVNPSQIEGKSTYRYTGNMGGGTVRQYDFVMTR